MLATGCLQAAPTVSLAWDQSPDTNVAGYKIYFGTTSHSYTQWLDVGNVTNAVIPLPDYDTTYYFAATTYDTDGMESDFSNEATYAVAALVVSNSLPEVSLPPTLAAIANVTVGENSGPKTVSISDISTGSGSVVMISAISSNPSLIPNPTINYLSPNAAGSLSFTSVSNATGSTVITVTVNNGQPTNYLAVQSFTVTVTSVYQSPTLAALGDVSISENAGPQTVSLAGISTGSGQAVTITASSSNPSLILNPTVSYSSPNAAGSLTFAPATNANGSAIITVTVNNGLPTDNIATQTFTVTVGAVNQPPTLDALGNLTLGVNSVAQTVALSGIGSGADNEIQTLTVRATSSNTKVIPTPTVSYSSPLATGTLTLKPSAKFAGSAVITVTINDGGRSNNIITRSFTVTVVSKVALSAAPKVSIQPQSQVVLSGKPAKFKVSASGKDLKYQWKRNGKIIAGAISSTLNMKKCSADQAGVYSVIVSNASGVASSEPAALTVTSVPEAQLLSSAHNGKEFSFDVVGVTGYKYAVEASPDLVHWTSVQTNTSPFTFVDPNADQSGSQFYRTVYVP
jgi:hypothetical protein